MECHDCGVEEGQLHVYGCDMERCPFCGRQLIGCGCCYDKLGLKSYYYGSKYSGLSKEVYENGLDEEQEKQWLEILTEKGRIPWIQYPNVCQRCGKLWPDLFQVPTEEWNHYVEPDMRNTVLCRSCYDWVKESIDRYSIKRLNLCHTLNENVIETSGDIFLCQQEEKST